MTKAVITVILVTFTISVTALNKKDVDLKKFLEATYEKSASQICTMVQEADWNFNTDVNNKKKEEIFLNVTLEAADFDKSMWEQYFKDVNPEDFSDKQIKRQLKELKKIGYAALSKDKLAKLTEAKNSLTNIYSTAKVCPYKKQNCDLTKEGLSLEPELDRLLSKSTDYEELVYIWKSWRDASGARMKELYKVYVDLSNEAAKLNGYKDMGDMWRGDYESPTFIEDIDDLWNQVEPLYSELHKYVSHKIKKRYGDKIDISDGLIPAHVFGNMWAQQWGDIAELVKPYPETGKIDLDAALKEQNYTVLKMFEVSDEFYKSLGLIPNDISYNTTVGAMIEKPSDGRDVVCHASAWDFCDGKNFRIKMCTEVKFKDFIVIHHEMGHIQYFLQYAKQPYVFRVGANPGFHEAIGDTIALSVSTPKHLQKIGLLQNYQDNDKFSINSLMDIALEKVAFLPFGLLIDKWRWDVFSGNVKEDNWNSHWVQYRKKYQKVKPPIVRSDGKDFDPGSKYHVPADSQYIAYFVAHILQFQFYKSLCIAAGEYNPDDKNIPLHKCDFYKSVTAGEKLRDGLSLGGSKHWSDVLEVMTGERKLNAGPLLEYFEPLYNFLKEENKKQQ